jgi:peptide chain release factor 1
MDSRDIEWTATRGSGPGGQHRNKTDSAVIVTHLPSGLVVRCEAERSQHRNRELALELLESRLLARQASSAQRDRNAARKQQIGTGQRGDKIRTIRFQDGVVSDHRTGQRWPLRQYLRGDWAWLDEAGGDPA